MKVLVTGGAGYIGSTIASALEGGHIPIILDSLVRGRAEFVHGRAFIRAILRMQACSSEKSLVVELRDFKPRVIN